MLSLSGYLKALGRKDIHAPCGDFIEQVHQPGMDLEKLLSAYIKPLLVFHIQRQNIKNL